MAVMGGRMVVASVSLGVINSVLCLKYFNLVQKNPRLGISFYALWRLIASDISSSDAFDGSSGSK